MSLRYAVVSGDKDVIKHYLPHLYHVVGDVVPDDELPSEISWTVIAGEDNAGWTLDDYVIPRLNSGLHAVFELIPKANSDELIATLRETLTRRINELEAELEHYRDMYQAAAWGGD